MNLPDIPYPTDIQPRDQAAGFEVVLIGADRIARNYGEPNLLEAIVKKQDYGIRLIVVHDLLSGLPAYQCQVYGTDRASSAGPEWTPLGMPRENSEDTIGLISADFAELIKFFPDFTIVRINEVPLFCTKCEAKFMHNESYVRLDEEVICPKCGFARVGRENITPYIGPNDGR